MTEDFSYMQKRLSSVWPEWNITRKIGKGTYGNVYELVRSDLGTTYKCALKVLYLEAEEEPSSEDMDYNDDPFNIPELFSSEGEPMYVTGLYKGALQDFITGVSKEIDVMMQLKGAHNIVSIEDYHVLREKNSCMIMIRMELLESLENYIKRTGPMQKADVIRLGRDICHALKCCEDNKILHRDIKPGNILYSENGGFKLGDFGISRTMLSIHEQMSMSSVGTLHYMPPEVYHGKRYDNTADIYSLGLVLYNILNGNLPPFLTRADRDRNGKIDMGRVHEANMKRLRGEPLPLPHNTDNKLGKIICKACASEPVKRYRTAEEFDDALQSCLNDNHNNKPAVALIACIAVALVVAVTLSLHAGQKQKAEPVVLEEKVYYTVLSRNADGETLNRIVKDGKAGEQISETAEVIEGYTPVEETQSLVLSDNASDNILVFLYEKNAEDINPLTAGTYTVVAVDNSTQEILSEKKYIGEKGKELTVCSPPVEGYIPQTEEQIFSISDNEANNVLYILYDSYDLIAGKYDIPDGKILKYKEHVYYAMHTDSIDSYWDANKYCEDHGGHLAVISNAAENAALYDYVFYNLNYESAYFGLTDDGSEGDWYWTDGSKVDYSNWLAEQPDNAGDDENYALFFWKDVPYKWNDGNFGKDKEGMVTFLIEWDEPISGFER